MMNVNKTCWMYKNAGEEINMVRVVKDGRVMEFPCKNTSEKTIRRSMRGMFGSLKFYVVEILPVNSKCNDDT